MRTLIKVNTSILKDYEILNDLNPTNWDISEYLDLKYDINAALAFSKLFFPDFVEEQGCIILAFRFNDQNFEEWIKHFDGNKSEVERICNSYDVADYFKFNRHVDESGDQYNKMIEEFAQVLKSSWEINCKLLFPDRKYIVEISEQYDRTRITLYSEY